MLKSEGLISSTITPCKKLDFQLCVPYYMFSLIVTSQKKHYRIAKYKVSYSYLIMRII